MTEPVGVNALWPRGRGNAPTHPGASMAKTRKIIVGVT